MILSHKIRIYPNRDQEQFLKKSCGVARFAYNWGLEEWQNQYKNGGKPNRFKLDKQFNSIKKQEFPFVCEVSKCCSQIAFANLGKAYKNFFDRRAKYPKFKKKGIHDSFGLDNLNFHVDGKHIKLAKMSPMRMAEPLRFDGKIMSGTVSRVADKWYISIAVEVKKDLTLPKTGKFVGVDLGVKDIAITSDGCKFANPRWIHKSEKKLKRLNRELARRKRASKRRERTRLRLARQHDRVANQRKDWLHKITTCLVRKYDVIALEDLNVRGMTKNHSLAKAITNVSFGEFNRQIEYKAQM
ncbi:MAG: transposase, partial [Fibrobacter sp.]|nr:transposase [Fibrobacter sp.]